MNYKIFQVVNQLAGHYPMIDALMVFVTQKALLIYAGTLLLMWFFGKKSYKETVIYTTLTGGIGLSVNFLIGQVYFEPRPFVTHTVHLLIPHAADASFPSDHTTGAFSLAFAVWFRHRKIGAGMLGLAILTGISRIYVGHHYPFDVLGSVAVGWGVSLLLSKPLHPMAERISDMIIHTYERMPFVPKSHVKEQ